MKRIILLAALFTGIITAANAQDKKISETSQQEASSLNAIAKQETDKLDKIVSLSADQRVAIQRVNLSLAHRMQTVKANSPQAEQDRVSKELDNVRTNLYLQHLTAEQQAKYKSYTTQKQ